MVSPVHPGPAAASIPATIVQSMIDHARTGVPNEACGLIVGDRPAAAGGRALRFEPTRNAAASPYRYEIHPEDLYRLTVATDDADQVFWGIVHSHTHTPAVPSPTDVGESELLLPGEHVPIVLGDRGEAEFAAARAMLAERRNEVAPIIDAMLRS